MFLSSHLLISLSILIQKSLCLIDQQNHPRIANEDVGEVVRCSFISLYGSANGAAIYINSPSSYSLSIDDSCFRSCVTSDRGGCIFFISKSLQIVESGFDLCYIHKAQNDIFGNSMYVESPKAILNETSYLKCGPDRSVCADSNQFITTSAFLASQMNCTECCSTGGTSSFTVVGAANSVESIAEYLNIVNVTSDTGIFIHQQTAEVKFSNFISMSISYSFFYSNGLMNVRNCFIWTGQSDRVVNSENNVKFDNCWGNIKYATSTSYQSIELEKNEVWLCGVDFPYHIPDNKFEVGKIKMVAALLCLPSTRSGPKLSLRINFDSK